MNYIFLAEQGEESSAASFSDIPPYALSNSTPTAGKSCCNDSGMESCPGSPYGTMFGLLTESLGEIESKWCAGGFPVLIYPKSSRMPKESKEKPADSGTRWRESPMKCDPVTFSLRTHRCLFDEDLDKSCATFPEWGIMLDGAFWEHDTPELVTLGIEFGYWATPNARDWKDTAGMNKERKDGREKIDQTPRQVYASLDGSGLFTPPTASENWGEIVTGTTRYAAQNAELITPNVDVPAQQWMKCPIKSGMESNTPAPNRLGLLNPAFSEWLMGWVIGWTDLKPLATGKLQAWRHSHGGYSPKTYERGHD